MCVLPASAKAAGCSFNVQSSRGCTVPSTGSGLLNLSLVRLVATFLRAQAQHGAASQFSLQGLSGSKASLPNTHRPTRLPRLFQCRGICMKNLRFIFSSMACSSSLVKQLLPTWLGDILLPHDDVLVGVEIYPSCRGPGPQCFQHAH